MSEILFAVAPEKTGGFSACWDDPLGGGISTQGKDLSHLQAMIREAVLCHFDEEDMPVVAKLHFVEDLALSLA